MKDTKGAENSTFIYELFDVGGSIKEHVNFKTTVTNLKANILSNGYLIASNSDKTLYINENIYTLSEIRNELNFHSGNNADLVLELIEKSGVKACRKLNGKYTIVLCESGLSDYLGDKQEF